MKTAWCILCFFLFAGLVVKQNPKPKIEVCLSAEEKKLFNMINQYRKSKNLPAVSYSAALSLVAQAHAKDLEINAPHKKEGCNMHSWSSKGKWNSCCYTADHAKSQCMWDKPKELTYYQGNGFEIAAGYYHSSGATMNAEQALSQWKSSPSHHDVILSRGIWKKLPWNAMGVGIYKQYAMVWFGNEPDPNNVIVVCK